MKYLLVLLVVAVGVMLLLGRSRRRGDAAAPPPPAAKGGAQGPAAMIACAHCGVHLPGDDAVRDSAGRGYCGDEHRRAGPR